MKDKTNMKNTLILIAIAIFSVGNSLSAAEQGWGKSQTQRTIGGVLGGATVGGIIGHQHGKQKEGIIIGSVLGMLIGNQSGKSKDIRQEQEQQQWEQRQREMAHQERMRREEQHRIEQARQYRTPQTRQTTSTYGSPTSSSGELTQARHRAEQREAELQREMEIRRIQEERRRALLEFQERERHAQEQLERIRNGESVGNTYPRHISHNSVY
jgi:hypothetical protein|tara:strand:+ start:1397 stop:2032 length:636 start_codon:yes stop_codon:yes gene_type:complete